LLEAISPSDLYTKSAPAALRIFDTFGKTTFATLSGNERTSFYCVPRAEFALADKIGRHIAHRLDHHQAVDLEFSARLFRGKVSMARFLEAIPANVLM
jgi:hypothetical protein